MIVAKRMDLVGLEQKLLVTPRKDQKSLKSAIEPLAKELDSMVNSIKTVHGHTLKLPKQLKVALSMKTHKQQVA